MKYLYLVSILFLILVLEGCFVTSSVINDFGVKRGPVQRVTRVSQNGEDYYVEFQGHDYMHQYRYIYFYKKIGKDPLFATTEQNLKAWGPKPGRIPEEILKADENSPKCLEYSNMQGMARFRETCANKESRLQFGDEYSYKSPWRPVLLPVLIPAGCVADVILAPILVGYFVKCAAFGCSK